MGRKFRNLYTGTILLTIEIGSLIMSVRKVLYLGFITFLPLIILLNSAVLFQEDSLDTDTTVQTASVEAVFESGSTEEIDVSDTLPGGNGSNHGDELSAGQAAEPDGFSTIEVLYLSGEVRPRDEVDIFPDTQGKIRELRVEPGDRVLPDQILAMVDPSRPGMNYTLNPVRSSISGTVTAVYSDPGGYITPGQPLCRVGTLSRLEIDVYIPEGYIEDVSRGMNAIVSSPVLPGLNETMILKSISPVVDPRSRCMKVIFEPKERNSRLKSGMYVDLAIKLE